MKIILLIKRNLNGYPVKRINKVFRALSLFLAFREIGPGAGYHAHHDFPFAFMEWFASKGVDVNQAAYGRWVKREEHLPWHGRAGGEFNQWWKDVIAADEAAAKAGDAILTKADVLNKLAEVRALFPATH
jgi:hypothetical protein